MAARTKPALALVESEEPVPAVEPVALPEEAKALTVTSVTSRRSYTFQTTPFESAVIEHTIVAQTPDGMGMSELGVQLQNEMDNLQSAELNRTADVMDSNPVRNKNSFIYSLLS